MEGSKAFHFNKQDLTKSVKGLLIAMAGAGLAYLAVQFQALEANPEMVFYAGFASAVINLLQRWITNQTK